MRKITHHKKRPFWHRVKKKIKGGFYNRDNRKYIDTSFGIAEAGSNLYAAYIFENTLSNITRGRDQQIESHINNIQKEFYKNRKATKFNSGVNKFTNVKSPLSKSIRDEINFLNKWKSGADAKSKIPRVSKGFMSYLSTTPGRQTSKLKAGTIKKFQKFPGKVLLDWDTYNPNYQKKVNPILVKKLKKNIWGNLGRGAKKLLIPFGIIGGSMYVKNLLQKKHKRRNRFYTLKQIKAGVHKSHRGY